MPAYILIISFKFLLDKGRKGMMFSCMSALLSRKDTLQLFQIIIIIIKKTMYIILKLALFFSQTSPKHNPHVYS